MSGQVKLGSLFDKRHELDAPKSAGGLLERITAMAIRIERRLKEAFNSGQATRRFDSPSLLLMPMGAFEEVGEATQKVDPYAGGRFGHVSALQLSGLEEVSSGDWA